MKLEMSDGRETRHSRIQTDYTKYTFITSGSKNSQGKFKILNRQRKAKPPNNKSDGMQNKQ